MNNPIRVLHVFGSLDAGGAESRTMDIYRSIDRNKVQFDFAIHTNKKCHFTDEIIKLGGNIYSFPRFNGKNYSQYKQEWKDFLQKNSEIKIIHGHQTSTAFIYLNEAKKQNIPIRIAHARNSNKDSIIKKYITKLARYYATHLFAVSKLAAISEFGNSNVQKNKVKIINNAIPIKKFSFDLKKRKLGRADFKIKDDTIVFIHIGRFHKQKNHEFLLEIFNEIHIKIKNSILLIVGDGEKREVIENKIHDLGLTNSVKLLGIRSDIHYLLSISDMLIFPSFYEGLPGVVLEVQASNLPCVISDTISEEVLILDSTFQYPLNNSAQQWAEFIISKLKKNNYKRKNDQTEIINAGFDILEIAKWYQVFYEETFKGIS